MTQLSSIPQELQSFLHGTDWSARSRTILEAALQTTGSSSGLVALPGEAGGWVLLCHVGAFAEGVDGQSATGGPRAAGGHPGDCAPQSDPDAGRESGTPHQLDQLIASTADHQLAGPCMDVPPTPWPSYQPCPALLVALRDGAGPAGALILAGRSGGYDEETVGALDLHRQLLALACRGQASLRQMLELEEQLERARQLEEVGRLACRIAHDFNNLLTAISGHTGMMLPALADDDPNRKHAEGVRMAAERATKLAQQLLNFSRHRLPQPEVLDMRRIVADIEPMLRSVLTSSISCRFHLPDGLWPVYADRSEIENAIVNLAVNARDAMNDGGQFILDSANAFVETGHASAQLELTAGRYVVLTVSDTGAGMEERVRRRIFEPFFTTKGRDHGTGLGLANVDAIIKRAGGSIMVYSEPGLGTTFKIYLPPAEVGAEAFPPATEARPAHKAVRGAETILLVEDEELVRELAAEILEDAGYTVLTASSYTEASKLAGDQGEGIALLVADLMLPQMNGQELAAKLRQTLPKLRVLFISGYADPRSSPAGIDIPTDSFLSKPFSAAGLLQKVRSILDSAG